MIFNTCFLNEPNQFFQGGGGLRMEGGVLLFYLFFSRLFLFHFLFFLFLFLIKKNKKQTKKDKKNKRRFGLS